jgi:hypothetical protein
MSSRRIRRPTIVTSNLPFDEWTGVFASERLIGVLHHRFTHHVHILETNGDSYRLEQSKRRLRAPRAVNSPGNLSDELPRQQQGAPYGGPLLPASVMCLYSASTDALSLRR